MATKTANILARVEPEVKMEAEKIMNELGIPASVVINMLYKQIILTKSIPFPLTLTPNQQKDLKKEVLKESDSKLSTIDDLSKPLADVEE